MPNNDQLTQRQRVRLESLAQAQAMIRIFSTEQPSEANVFQLAERIEAWLSTLDKNLN